MQMGLEKTIVKKASLRLAERYLYAGSRAFQEFIAKSDVRSDFKKLIENALEEIDPSVVGYLLKNNPAA